MTRDPNFGRRRRGFIRHALLAAGGGALAARSGDAFAAGKGHARSGVLRSGSEPPKAREGRPGDFYLDTRRHRLYGPKRKAPKGRNGWGVPTNLRGLRGETGPAGARGYSVLSGRGAPAAGVGVDREFYIDVTTAQIYGPKSGGVWGSPTSLTGPAGPSQNAAFVALAAEPDLLIIGDIERDDQGSPLTAAVVWPDGTPGRYKCAKLSQAFPGAVDAYAISYGVPALLVYTQPPVSRDPSSGAITHRPSITVS